MQTFVAGQPVEITVPLLDSLGNVLTPTKAVVTIRGDFGDALEVIEPELASPLSFKPGAASALPDDRLIAARQAEVLINYLDIATSMPQEKLFTVEWVLRRGLEPGRNSVLSLHAANALSLSMQLDGWSAADDARKTPALLEAWRRMRQLTFDLSGYQDDRGEVDQSGPFTLNDATRPLHTLPSRFIDALSVAQLLEADTILGGEPLQDKRLGGLMSETTGESSMMFRPGKPLEMPVSRRTLGALRSFIVVSTLRIGRA
ncbi:hypothetical protein [Chromobacterium phragmitis]|uniref:Baseplate protein J-like domain-containing protein n=1 Tax=Chromobacterium phragmitis TaxID=2202141 RepID=A0ABV0J0I4_9NEIS